MIRTLKTYILDNWQQIRPGTTRPDDLSFMLQGSPLYRTAHTKVIVLFFVPGDSRPIVVGKVPDDPAFAGNVETEYAHLRRMHEGPYSDALKAAIPRPIALQRIGKDTVMLESAVPGESMSIQMLRNARSDRYMRDAYADVLVWLTQMRNDELNCPDAAAQAAAVIEVVLDLYDELYHPRGEEREILAAAWEIVEPLIGNALPVVPSHGDFWVNNIFRHGRRVVGVVDWEYARPASPPLWDLFQFEFSMAIRSHPDIDLQAIFETAFFREGSLGREFARVLRSYCETYGIGFSPRVIEALFVLWIADTAVKERELFGRSYETDMLRHDNVRIYLENRKPDWTTFAD